METADIWRVGLVGIASAAIFIWGYRQHQKEMRVLPWLQKLDAEEEARRALLPERPPSAISRIFRRKKPGAP